MRLLVTGASGFLGQQVVKAAVNAGYDVMALVRPTADVRSLGWPDSVDVLRGDLRQEEPWAARVRDVDAVAHLAAAASGDLAHQFAGTVVATENLLRQLPMSSLVRFVHVSSFSVYDFTAVPKGRPLTEATPVEPEPAARDAYTVTKVLQERLVRDSCRSYGTPLVVLRPGAVYGPGKVWQCGSSFTFGRFDLVFAPLARLRLTYVTNCAEAVVKAISASVTSGSTFNIIDDDVPTHASYHRLCGKAGGEIGWPVYVPWTLVSIAGRAVGWFNDTVLHGRAKLPEFLAHRRQQARWKPLTYPNGPAKRALDWAPQVELREGIERAQRAQQSPLAAPSPSQ